MIVARPHLLECRAKRGLLGFGTPAAARRRRGGITPAFRVSRSSIGMHVAVMRIGMGMCGSRSNLSVQMGGFFCRGRARSCGRGDQPRHDEHDRHEGANPHFGITPSGYLSDRSTLSARLNRACTDGPSPSPIRHTKPKATCGGWYLPTGARLECERTTPDQGLVTRPRRGAYLASGRASPSGSRRNFGQSRGDGVAFAP